ncbi:MAG: fatty acid desaturase [Xanthomonadales bacterium]|nr:fatty acid desaturase [Xanthomonadales bacterium]
MNECPTQLRSEFAEWKRTMSNYREPSFWRAAWQLLNTLGGYFLVWCAIFLSLDISWWLTAPLAVLAGALLVRIFIIFHDCGHGSYFKSKRANSFWGCVCGVLTFTPFFRWRRRHARHHVTSGNLDRRGTGDIWTLTVQEYLDASRWQRLAYRVVRNPLVLFVIGPLFLLLGIERVPSRQDMPRERRSVWWMNLAMLCMAVGLGAAFGFVNYLLIQLIVTMVAGSAGVWLFYVQHQFVGTYWARKGEWDYTAAALQGSSYYRLPKVLQWFSGNIGFHHIHHLNPSIPNYHLERCHLASPFLRQVEPLTLLASLKSLSLRLWDESEQRLVSYRHMHRSGPGMSDTANTC